METVLPHLEETLCSALAVVSIPRNERPICGAPDDVRNYLGYAEKVTAQLIPTSDSTAIVEEHHLSPETIRDRVLRKPKAFHVPISKEKVSPLCKGMFNVSIRSKRLGRKKYLIDTTRIFNFTFTDGTGTTLKEASRKAEIDKIYVVTPSPSFASNNKTLRISATFSLAANIQHTVIIETIPLNRAFNSLFTKSKRQSYLLLSQDPEDFLELFGVNPGITAIIWHSAICHSMAVQTRWQYGILNSIESMRLAFSQHNAKLYFSNNELYTDVLHERLSKYKTFSNTLKISLQNSVSNCHIQLFSKDGANMNLAAISNEFHTEAPTTTNGEEALSSWHILNIIEIVIRECEDVAIGIPGLSTKSVMIRKRKPNEPKMEKIKEAARVLENIRYHKEGGYVYCHWRVRLIALLWLVFSVTIGALTAAFNWGNRTSALERIYDFVTVVSFLLFSLFAFVRFRGDEDNSTLRHALRGIKVLRNIMDVEKYYLEKLEEICPASDRNDGTYQAANGAITTSHSGENIENISQGLDHVHGHSEALSIHFEVAICATERKLDWLDGSHACYLDQTPTGNITFKRGIYVPRLKMYGVLVDKQATFHYTKGKSTINSANDYSMVLHMDRQLEISDLFMQGEIIIYSKERAGSTYNLV